MVLSNAFVRNWKYLLWTLALVTIAVVLSLTLFAAPTVTVVTVEKRDLTSQVYGNGTVEAKVVVGVSSKITGKIIELHADQGDRVTRGQLLAKLENDDFIQQERQSEAGLNKSAASLNVEQATLQKAKVTLLLAEKNARRYRTLAEKNLISKVEAEQYETACQVATEEVTRSQAAVNAVRMEQQASRAGLGFTKSRSKDTLIYAPHDGIIISRDLEAGATVTPGMPLFTLADPRTIWLKANVDESQLTGIVVGKKAVITLRSAGSTQFSGSVARLGRQSDRVTEELEVDVAFSKPLANFRLGEQGDVYIITGEKKAVPSIPSSAIVVKNALRGVWVVTGGKLAFKPVTIGIVDRRNLTEIVSGLTGTEQVVLTPATAKKPLRDTMKVHVSP